MKKTLISKKIKGSIISNYSSSHKFSNNQNESINSIKSLTNCKNQRKILANSDITTAKLGNNIGNENKLNKEENNDNITKNEIENYSLNEIHVDKENKSEEKQSFNVSSNSSSSNEEDSDTSSNINSKKKSNSDRFKRKSLLTIKNSDSSLVPKKSKFLTNIINNKSIKENDSNFSKENDSELSNSEESNENNDNDNDNQHIKENLKVLGGKDRSLNSSESIESSSDK